MTDPLHLWQIWVVDTGLWSWVQLAAAWLALTAALAFVHRFVARRLEAHAATTPHALDNYAAKAVREVRLIPMAALTLAVLWPGLRPADGYDAWVGRGLLFALLAQIGIWGHTLSRMYVRRYARFRPEDGAGRTTVQALSLLVRIALYATIVLIGLDNVGVNVSTAVAGLGIGGVAVALAVQNILGDLFASLSIVLDKPFVVGDFLIVGEHLGEVEHVGLKTTRVRSLWGEQLIFSNSDLLGSRIRNFQRMEERRIQLVIGVTYQTPADQLDRIPELIREAVEAQPDVRFERSHFFRFGPSSLDFETIWWVGTNDYQVYMDRQHAVQVAIVRAFEAQGITFAYPTQTVHLAPTPQLDALTTRPARGPSAARDDPT